MQNGRLSIAIGIGGIAGAILTTITIAGAGGLSSAEVIFYGIALGIPIFRIAMLSARATKLDVLDPTIFLPITVGLTFGSGPSVLRAEGRSADAETVTNILLLGLVFYFGGVIFANVLGLLSAGEGRTISPDAPRPSAGNDLAVKVLFCLGTVAMVLYWGAAGTIPILSPDVENARIAALTGAGVPFYLSMALMTSVWWAYMTDALTRRQRRLLLMVALLLLASTGWRNTPFALLAVTLLVVHYRKGFRHITLAGAALVITSGAAALGIYRVVASNITGYKTYKLVSEGRYVEAISTYFSSYTATFSRNLADVVQLTPSVIPPERGETFIWNFLALVPGQEREPFDFVLKEASGQGFEGGGLPPTLFGEWILNFGYVGLAAGMFLVGIVATIAHRAVIKPNSPAIQFAGILVSYYLFVSVRGGLGNVALTLTWLLVTVVIASFLANGTRSRGLRAEPTKQGSAR